MSSLRVPPGVGSLVEPVERDGPLARVERIEVLEPARPVRAAGEGRRHAARRHHAVGIALALVQARRADQAKRRPLRKAGRQLAVVGQGGDPFRLVDAVDPLVGNEARGHCSLYRGSFLINSSLAGSSIGLPSLMQVEAGIDRRHVHGVAAVDRAGRPDGQEDGYPARPRDASPCRRAVRIALPQRRSRPALHRSGRSGVSASMPRGLNGSRRSPRLAVIEAPAAQRRITRVGHVARSERRAAVRPEHRQFDEPAEAAARLVVVLLGHDRTVGQLRLEVKRVRAFSRQERAQDRPPVGAVGMDAPQAPQASRSAALAIPAS